MIQSLQGYETPYLKITEHQARQVIIKVTNEIIITTQKFRIKGWTYSLKS